MGAVVRWTAVAWLVLASVRAHARDEVNLSGEQAAGRALRLLQLFERQLTAEGVDAGAVRQAIQDVSSGRNRGSLVSAHYRSNPGKSREADIDFGGGVTLTVRQGMFERGYKSKNFDLQRGAGHDGSWLTLSARTVVPGFDPRGTHAVRRLGYRVTSEFSRPLVSSPRGR